MMEQAKGGDGDGIPFQRQQKKLHESYKNQLFEFMSKWNSRPQDDLINIHNSFILSFFLTPFAFLLQSGAGEAHVCQFFILHKTDDICSSSYKYKDKYVLRTARQKNIASNVEDDQTL